MLFARATCGTCPVRALCTRSLKDGRKLSLPPRERAELLARNRAQATDEAYQRHYGLRSGVEACISQAVGRWEADRPAVEASQPCICSK